MKKLAILFFSFFFLSTYCSGQYYYVLNASPGENPGSLNQDAEVTVGGLAAGWTSILGPSIATPTWSANRTIPFSFNFNGAAVTAYKVSSTGVLTFTTAALSVPPLVQTGLPSASIPDKSICIWGLHTSGTNDEILTKTFGTSPNRQHWIYFSSHTLNGAGGWSYWSIVLEESTDNIYLVDQRHSTTTGGACLGIQVDGTTAFSVTGSPSVLPLAANGSAATDNAYYEFIYGTQIPVDGELLSFETPSYVSLGNVSIYGDLKNLGASTITSLDINYSIDNGTAVTQTITGLSVTSSSETSYTHPTPWAPSISGTYIVKVWLSNVNGLGPDGLASNDTLTRVITVKDPIPNIISSYILPTNTFTYTTIVNSTNQVSTPRDLDFHPNGDLWTINKGTVNSGGSTVKITNPGVAGQTSLWQTDGNAWHFMSLPSAIAFSTDNANFATSTSVFDANHNGTDFTGPTLWSSDPAIYALPSGGNGSHLDMLHESPHCMGIAHEVGNVFWVFDGYSNDIVRYDFAEDHGPGNADHDDGRVRRYPQVVVNYINTDISSHLVLQKTTNWLYIVDGGNQRILRLDITSGTPGGTPSFPVNETLAEYTNVNGVTWEVVADTLLIQPSGIDVIEDRLVVSDHSTGDIIFYDISGNMPASELGRIVTGEPGIMGLVIGPQGRIWYANATLNKIVKIEPNQLVSIEVAKEQAASPIMVYPNPSNGLISVEHLSPSTLDYSIRVVDVSGKEVHRVNAISEAVTSYDFSHLPNGLYLLTVDDGLNSSTKKFVIKH